MKLTKIIALVLVVVMAGMLIVACADNTPNNTTTTTSKQDGTTTTTTTKKETTSSTTTTTTTEEGSKPVDPKPDTFESNFEVKAGEPKLIYVDVDSDDIVTIKFKFAQNGTATGGAGIDAALLAIDKKCALRVTGGGATHIMNADGTPHSNNWWGYKGEDYPTSLCNAKFVINVAEKTVQYSIGWDPADPKVVGKLTSEYDFDLENGIKLTFGAIQGKDVTIADLTIEK